VACDIAAELAQVEAAHDPSLALAQAADALSADGRGTATI